MPTLIYAEIKLKAGTKDEISDLVCSPEGFPITKSKPGFISAETAISTDESGQNTFHLWEKMEDFENYMQDPNRNSECAFMQKWGTMMDGPPKMIFPELLDL